MFVKDLKEILNGYPDDALVVISDSGEGISWPARLDEFQLVELEESDKRYLRLDSSTEIKFALYLE